MYVLIKIQLISFKKGFFVFHKTHKCRAPQGTWPHVKNGCSLCLSFSIFLFLFILYLILIAHFSLDDCLSLFLHVCNFSLFFNSSKSSLQEMSVNLTEWPSSPDWKWRRLDPLPHGGNILTCVLPRNIFMNVVLHQSLFQAKVE